MEDKRNTSDGIEVLYKENGQITRVYLEWRHKVLVRFFLALAGTLIMARWMFDNESLHNYLYVPFLLGGIMSFITTLMDDVNGRVLGNCYKNGEDIEKMINDVTGIYTSMNNQYSHPVTYTNILRILYFGSGVVFLILALVVNYYF
jgi:hypothetical protein